MKTLGINVPCLVNSRRTAVVDSSMRLVIGHDLFYFAGPRERERFVKDPLRYCRRLTDPVTLRRFEPRRTSPKLEYHGRMYYFAGDSTLGCSEPRPTASPCARECDGEPRPGPYHQDEGLDAGAWMSIDPRITSAFETDNGFPLAPHLIVLALMGSHGHGTCLPPEEPDAVDDLDFMGFVVPPLAFHIGLPRWEHWRLQADELDVVMYSLDKAVHLLLESNPNIVGLLWLRDSEYAHRHETFELLRGRRDIFSSQAAADSFTGYALDQLRRMEAFDLERMAEYEALTE